KEEWPLVIERIRRLGLSATELLTSAQTSAGGAA
ncbi:MAG: GntR family transcriptional regulator, partial [Betaproteobacteria bacterium]|nr:GntR family transcriptional regulator [Betaproteobacteria bacterium]